MDSKDYIKPNRMELLFNRLLGFLASTGIGPSYMYLLQVAGRKTGRIYETPVNLMEVGGTLYLVAPRGQTQWVKNARKAPTVCLKRGARFKNYQTKELSEEQKPPLLKEYLERYTSAVQRYFPVKAGSPLELYVQLSKSYPVFELKEVGKDNT